MNIGVTIDRVIGTIAPGWGARRLTHRATMALMSRALDGGTSDRHSGRARWRRQGPKERTRQSLESTRTQARYLYTYNAFARGTINSIVVNLIGNGIRPQGRVVLPKKGTPDEKFNDSAEEGFKRWGDAADPTGKESIYEQQRLLMTDYYVAGESLLHMRTLPPDAGDRRKVRLATEVLASERIDSSKDEPEQKDGSKIVQGVQFSQAGLIDGYWIYPNHPLDSVYGSDKSRLVPAKELIHFHQRTEAEQVRGLTRMLTVENAFEAISEWLDWLLTKEKIAAAFAAAITQPNGFPIQRLLPPDPNSPGDEDDDDEIDLIEGGMVAHLKPGQDVKSIVSGVQASNVDILFQIFLRVVARGLDVAYELVARDLSKVTFLSARQGETQDRRHWEPQQEHMNRVVNVPVWKEFIRAGVLAQVLVPRAVDLERYYDVEFIRPGWDWVDPGKDIAAHIAAINAGLESPLQVVASRGRDAYQVLRDCAQFKQTAKDLGLELTLFTEAKPKTDVTEPKEAKVDDEEAK